MSWPAAANLLAGTQKAAVALIQRQSPDTPDGLIFIIAGRLTRYLINPADRDRRQREQMPRPAPRVRCAGPRHIGRST